MYGVRDGLFGESPASEALEDELAWEKTFANESKERRKRSPLLYMAGRAPKAAVQHVTKRNKLLDFVTKNIKPGPILDIGCAGGILWLDV